MSGTSTGGGAATQSVLCTVGRRSSVATGGTTVTVPGIANDTSNPSATASVRYYTSPPSLNGTLVGLVGSFYLPLVAGSTLATPYTAYSYGEGGTQPIVLRGVNQGITLANRVAMVGTNTLSVWVEFSEE